jgi:hypothetical protein
LCNYGCGSGLPAHLMECLCFTDVESSSPCFCCCLTCACRSLTAQTRGFTCCKAEPVLRAPRRFNRWLAGWRSDDLQTHCVIMDVAVVVLRILWNVYVLRMWNHPLRVCNVTAHAPIYLRLPNPEGASGANQSHCWHTPAQAKPATPAPAFQVGVAMIC